jgi:hypothetical protein
LHASSLQLHPPAAHHAGCHGSSQATAAAYSGCRSRCLKSP